MSMAGRCDLACDALVMDQPESFLGQLKCIGEIHELEPAAADSHENLAEFIRKLLRAMLEKYPYTSRTNYELWAGISTCARRLWYDHL